MSYSEELLIAKHGMTTMSGDYYECTDERGRNVLIKNLGFRFGDKIKRVYSDNQLIKCFVNGSQIEVPKEKSTDEKIKEMRLRNGL